MKRMIGIAAILLLLGTTAFGADWEGRLPSGTSERVKASAREAVRAGVDPDEIVSLTAKMEASRFDESLMIRAHEIVMAARQEKLPVEPIMNKALEGIAKRVAAEKTVQAMETVRSRYAMAFQNARSIAAEEKQRQALGKTIAEGLAAGIQQREMVRMTEVSGSIAASSAANRGMNWRCNPFKRSARWPDWALLPLPSGMSYARPCSINLRHGKWLR